MRATWIAACSILVTVGCDRSEPGPDTRPAPATTTPAPAVDDERAPAVVLTASTGKELRVAVEVARTPRERNRGLMFREELAQDRGMLFIFEREEIQSFWMKNTLIPLDIIFIGTDMTIAGIVERATPRTLTSRKVDAPSIYVLEVNGGWTEANDVAAGDGVRFENISF